MDTPGLQSTQKWLRVYHIVTVVLDILAALLLVMISFFALSDPSAFDSRADYTIFVVVMFGTIAFMIVTTFVSVLAAAIVKKRGKINWIFQLVLVILGFGSLITILPCLFLFLGLISDEAKEYYLNK